LTKKSVQQHISDLITERLKTALTKEDEATKDATPQTADQQVEDASKVVTTPEELEAFMIVKTILRQKISATRVAHRDAQSYFAILLDDNNRKTICRLYFGTKKFIGVLDDQKKEVKKEIATLDDIFKYADDLLKTVESYDKSKDPA
jgi:predicted type IV restriction endonuclease